MKKQLWQFGFESCWELLVLSVIFDAAVCIAFGVGSFFARKGWI